MKKPIKKLAKFVLYILVIAVPTLIALKCGKMNQAKKLKGSPNHYEAPKVDKVSDTYNARKIEWLKSVYNYELINAKR